MKKCITALMAFLFVGALGFVLGGLDWSLRPTHAQLNGKVFPKVEIHLRGETGGLVLTDLRAVEGLDAECEVIEFADGEDPVLRKRPGRVKYGNITLKRGYTAGDDELYEWFQAVQKGSPLEKKAGFVVAFDEDDKPVMRYDFFEAWPCKWKGPVQVSSSTVLDTEEITLVVEEIRRS